MIRQLRNTLRRIVDRAQFEPIVGAKKLGQPNGWVVNTDFLDGPDASPILFSGGAGHDISFELDFIKNFGGKVYLYDPSETGWTTICNTPRAENLVCHRAALATTSSVSLAPPEDPTEGSWRLPNSDSYKDPTTQVFPAVSLVSEIERYGYAKIDVLKLDIEGFEYQVLCELLDSKISVRQILVEFHDFLPGIGRGPTKSMKNMLKSAGYKCFYKCRYDHCYIHRSTYQPK